MAFVKDTVVPGITPARSSAPSISNSGEYARGANELEEADTRDYVKTHESDADVSTPLCEDVTPQSEQSEINARLSGASVEHCTREAARLHRASEELWDKQVASVDLWEGLPEGDPRIPDLMEETHQYEMVALILQHSAERMRVRADCYGF